MKPVSWTSGSLFAITEEGIRLSIQRVIQNAKGDVIFAWEVEVHTGGPFEGKVSGYASSEEFAKARAITARSAFLDQIDRARDEICALRAIEELDRAARAGEPKTEN